ncbi:STAS domain-containing protein [Streptomyces sp. NK15101]|uniref:STAS domain-containing protein n=1 Tax=Streptomyces sp. NK15101 TaxID=2873261 RepID=UPI001CECAE11|nr:STAS domain-containing protein [Streptomyces sp. NK15101]
MIAVRGFAEDGAHQGLLGVGPHTCRSPGGVATVTREPTASAGTWLLSARGEFDRDTLPCLHSALCAARRARAGRIVLDLSGATFGDSSFLQELIEAHRRPGRLLLVGPLAGQIRRLLELTGMDRVFDLADDRHSAGLV